MIIYDPHPYYSDFPVFHKHKTYLKTCLCLPSCRCFVNYVPIGDIYLLLARPLQVWLIFDIFNQLMLFLDLGLGVNILLLSVTLRDSTVLQNFCLIKVKQVRNTFSANLPSQYKTYCSISKSLGLRNLLVLNRFSTINVWANLIR